MQKLFTIPQLSELFELTGRDERSIRNWLAQKGLSAKGSNSAGLKAWDMREVLLAIDTRDTKADLAAAKLVGAKLDNEKKKLDNEKRLAEIRADQRTEDLTEFRAVLKPLRELLNRLDSAEVNAALDEVAEWAQSQGQ